MSVIQVYSGEALSTTLLARKNNISNSFLFAYLVENGYVLKNYSEYVLTDKGSGIGGSYIERGKQKWIVWSGNSLDSLVASTVWNKDIKGKFNSVKKSARERLNLLDLDRDSLHEQLNNGRKIIESHEELDVYTLYYGAMHHAKLQKTYGALHAKENLSALLSGKDIQIIDYACGQGFASIVFLEYLRAMDVKYSLSQITLIEPSVMALAASEAHLCGYAKALKSINKKFDAVLTQDVVTTRESIKFHLFSNTLDMGGEHFNIENLADKIMQSQKGVNYFICVSPHEKEKLNGFMRYFSGRVELASFDGVIPNPSKWDDSRPWSCIYNVFKVVL